MTDWNNLFSTKRNWPEAGDTLFSESKNASNNAHIDRFGHHRLQSMADGFKKAADLSVEQSTRDRMDRDMLIFPIIYNYRHFIELSLKYLIDAYGDFVEISPIWNTHDLSKLWKTLIDLFKRYGVDEVDEATSIVGEFIAEFDRLDPGSFHFRYPKDRDGNLIQIDRELFDLKHFFYTMDKIWSYFNGCDVYLDDLKHASP